MNNVYHNGNDHVSGSLNRYTQNWREIGKIYIFWCKKLLCLPIHDHIDGLVQERCNSIANTLELCLSGTNPSLCDYKCISAYTYNGPRCPAAIAEATTVETLYNTVNFCWSTHKRHSIACPKGRGMECLLWVQRATYCVDLSKLSSIKYLLNHAIKGLHCILVPYHVAKSLLLILRWNELKWCEWKIEYKDSSTNNGC